MSPVELERIWMEALRRSGLPLSEQQELLARVNSLKIEHREAREAKAKAPWWRSLRYLSATGMAAVLCLVPFGSGGPPIGVRLFMFALLAGVITLSEIVLEDKKS